MWRAGVDTKFSNTESAEDDWETDPDFVVSIAFKFVTTVQANRLFEYPVSRAYDVTYMLSISATDYSHCIIIMYDGNHSGNHFNYATIRF